MKVPFERVHSCQSHRDIDDGVLETARLSGIRARGGGRARAIEQRSASERLAQVDREVDARQVRGKEVAIRARCGGRIGRRGNIRKWIVSKIAFRLFSKWAMNE